MSDNVFVSHKVYFFGSNFTPSFTRSVPIPPDLIGGDYIGDAAYRERVQTWVREMWERKDAEIDRLLKA